MTVSAHILIDNDLDELSLAGCPPLYEVLVQRNIISFMEASKITLEEFHHYCKRLNAAIAHKPRSAA